MARSNPVWAADLTALPTREGWAYLAVLLDLYSRRVVGWVMTTQLDTRLVLTAWRRALAATARAAACAAAAIATTTPSSNASSAR